MAKMPVQQPATRSAPYRQLFAHQAYILCQHHGYTDAQLAEVLDVSLTTLAAWKEKHASFREAIEKGQAEFDTECVESALVRRATGFVRKTVTTKTGRRQGQKYTETIEVREEVPGDVRAQELWLCSRNPERWQRPSGRRRPAPVPTRPGASWWSRSRRISTPGSGGCRGKVPPFARNHRPGQPRQRRPPSPRSPRASKECDGAIPLCHLRRPADAGAA